MTMSEFDEKEKSPMDDPFWDHWDKLCDYYSSRMSEGASADELQAEIDIENEFDKLKALADVCLLWIEE